MKQKMKKFLLSVLLCVTFGLIVPLTALAADVSNPEEADYVLKMSQQVIQEITSTDSGATWTRTKTNITDVRESTPSLIFDTETGLVSNYYYQRGAKKLKRRVVDAAFIFDRPESWPEPDVLAEGGEARSYDAGNVKATVSGDRHFIALYSGTKSDCAVFVVSVPAPVAKPE